MLIARTWAAVAWLNTLRRPHLPRNFGSQDLQATTLLIGNKNGEAMRPDKRVDVEQSNLLSGVRTLIYSMS